MHDDVRLDDVDDVVDGLPELVRRVVVEEPVRRPGRHVVGDLGHELAVAGAVAVVVASGEPVGLVEREAVLAVERGQLRARERVQPARGAEGLVEHHDRDAGPGAPAALQRVGAGQRDALRDDRIGGGRLGELGARDGRRAAHACERAGRERGLEAAADPALRNAPGRDDGRARRRARAGRCHKDRAGDGRPGRAGARRSR